LTTKASKARIPQAILAPEALDILYLEFLTLGLKCVAVLLGVAVIVR
jgi:hypothetical protein